MSAHKDHPKLLGWSLMIFLRGILLETTFFEYFQQKIIKEY